MGKKGSSLEEDKEQLQRESDAAKRQLEELQQKHSEVQLLCSSLSKILVVKLCIWQFRLVFKLLNSLH